MMAEMRRSPIRFGTDGWRAVIGEDFTFENVRICARAVAEYFRETYGTERPLVVGYDTRFLSEEFALEAARVAAAAGFRVQLASRPAPTPAVSYRILEVGACGAIVITSSHNPYKWNGLKVKPHYAGSASPEVVAAIEARIPALLENPEGVVSAPKDSDAIERFDPVPGYLAAVSRHVDLDRVRAAGLRVAVDQMFGAGAGLFPELLQGGATTCVELHGERNPLFPGLRAPEPIEPNLGELLNLVASGGFDLGVANDGDADRVGLVDERGRFVDQLRTFALIAYYLLEVRGFRGPIVKSLTTTEMVRILAERYGVECLETPVGFKYIGPLMMERDALVGGEESGGYGFRGHLPERDGILAGLFLIDMAARTGKRPSELLDDVFQVTGPHYYRRIDVELEAGEQAEVRARLEGASPAEVAGRPVLRHDTTDGWRFFVPEGWLLLRLSGTEPLLRVYCEVRDEELVEPLLAAGLELAGVRQPALSQERQQP
jgi:phosphomannomutase